MRVHKKEADNPTAGPSGIAMPATCRGGSDVTGKETRAARPENLALPVLSKLDSRGDCVAV